MPKTMDDVSVTFIDRAFSRLLQKTFVPIPEKVNVLGLAAQLEIAEKKDMIYAEMVEKFQCQGCMHEGGGASCSEFKLKGSEGKWCENHIIGTLFSTSATIYHVAIGLPKGFGRSSPCFAGKSFDHNRMGIRLWVKEDIIPIWNELNVPVWALEEGGFLFVRTYSPRIDLSYVDVMEGGTLALVPNAIDVSKYKDKFE